MKEEENRKLEEERRKLEEEELKRLGEEQKKRIEEDKRRRLEDEQKRKEQEQRRKKMEEEQNKLDEEGRKLQQEKLILEAENNRRMDEERMSYLDKKSSTIYTHKQTFFDTIPGHTMSYWVKDAFIDKYSERPNLGTQVDCFQGMIPGDVRKYLRKWYEISQNSMLINEEQFGQPNGWEVRDKKKEEKR